MLDYLQDSKKPNPFITEAERKEKNALNPVLLPHMACTFTYHRIRQKNPAISVSPDFNDDYPNPHRLGTNNFYITIAPDMVRLNKRKLNQLHVTVTSWGRTKQWGVTGAAAVYDCLRDRLQNGVISKPLKDPKTGLHFANLTGFYITLIKNKERMY